MNIPKGLTQEDLDRYAKLDAGIKKLTVEKNELNSLIKEKVTKVGTYLWGKVVVKVSTAKSKDVKAAEARFPRAEYPALYTETTTYSLNWDAMSAADQDKFTTLVPRLSVDIAK